MRKGLKTLIAGIVIFLIGLVIIPVIVIVGILTNQNAGWQFIVPGSAQIQVEQPGKYYLWNDFHTVYNNRTYSQSPQLPNGLTIRVTDARGNPLEFTNSMGISVNIGNNAKNSIGFIKIDSPSTIMVAVEGDVPERVFSLAAFEFKVFIKVIIICLLLALTGAVLGIWGIIKLSKSGKKS